MVDAWGMQGAMLGWAVPSVAIAIACALMVSENPAGGGVQTGEIGLRDALGPLLRDRSLLILFAVSAAGLGYFNGLTTWLEPIVAPNGLDAVQAGIIGGVLVLGGIVGAVVIPALSDKFQRRKVFVLGSVVAAIATLWPMVETRDYTVALVSGGAQGFFFLPAYALLLEICSELAGKALAGSATGLLMLAGNGGGVLVIVAMAALKSDADGWKWPIVLMFALLAAALGGTALLPETWHRKLQASSAA
jgi:MFS family permease